MTSRKKHRTGFTAISCVACWFMVLVARTTFAAPRAAKELPPEVSIGQDIREGAHLYVTLKLENGTPINVIVDTGCPDINLDVSLAPFLGPVKDKKDVIFPAIGYAEGKVYDRPKFFLNGTELMAEGRVTVYPFRKRVSTETDIRGILGLNCLKHYCLQIDPVAGKLRFLKSGNPEKADWGRRFDFTINRYVPLAFVNGNLLGENNTEAVLDTGCPPDGALHWKTFGRALRRPGTEMLRLGNLATANPPSLALLPEGTFHRTSYTNLMVCDLRDFDMIGLRFLARHVATLDFPAEYLYLRRIDDSVTIKSANRQLETGDPNRP